MARFHWLTDLVTHPKIIAARLDEEFNYTGHTQVNNNTTTVGELRFNEINITSNVKVTHNTPSTVLPYVDNVAAGFKVTQNVGANGGGFQIPGLFRLNHTIATEIWAGSAACDFVSLASQGYSNAADNSASGAGAGFYGANFAVWMGPSAVHNAAIGCNPQLICETGMNVDNRVGLRVQSSGDSGARGSDVDAAITVISQTNSWKDGIVFGEPNGLDTTPALHTSGSIMRAQSTMTVTNGLDFTNATVTGDIFKVGTVFRIKGNGQHYVNLNETSNVGYETNNANTGGVAAFTAVCGGTVVGEYGVRGSARAAYGALVANDSYVYGNGATGVTIIADNSTGVIKFAAGGNTERARISAAGDFTYTGAAWASTTPTPTSTIGSFTTVSASLNHKQLGKIVFVRGAVLVTTIGTAAGRVKIPLPVSVRSGTFPPLSATRNMDAVLPSMAQWDTADQISISLTGVVNGDTVYFNGSYEAA